MKRSTSSAANSTPVGPPPQMTLEESQGSGVRGLSVAEGYGEGRKGAREETHKDSSFFLCSGVVVGRLASSRLSEEINGVKRREVVGLSGRFALPPAPAFDKRKEKETHR